MRIMLELSMRPRFEHGRIWRDGFSVRGRSRQANEKSAVFMMEERQRCGEC